MKSKINTNHKNLIFVFGLLLSNILAFQLGEIVASDRPPPSKMDYLREKYVHIRIKAQSIVPFQFLEAVHILKKNRLVGHAFLISDDQESESYIIYTDAKNIKTLLHQEHLKIVPYSKTTNFNTSKRKSYEVYID